MPVIATQIPVGTWTVDPLHSTAEFSVKQLISTFRAGFGNLSGRLEELVARTDARLAA